MAAGKMPPRLLSSTIDDELTIQKIWFGIGDDSDETFTVGDDYGRNENYVITKIVETANFRVRVYSNDIVLCDVLNVTKMDYI